MDIDDLFADEIAELATPLDEMTVRRMVGQVFKEYDELLGDPERLAALDADIARCGAAEKAFEAAVEAEEAGDDVAAATEYEVAAREGLGDATLRLARCLVRSHRYRAALEWCDLAEADGFDEAVDLAARCCAELGEQPPARARPEAPVLPAGRAEPEPERASGPRDTAGDSADPGLTRRLKALACTAPLHDLDTRKAMLDWIEPTDYQMAEIALRTIDLVAINMDFDRGAAHDDVIAKVVPFVAKQAPGRPTHEHARVARWVLERMINVGTVDRSFYQVYGEIDINGLYHRQPFHYKIVKEVPGPRGSHALRVSDEAITVLVGALDTDVESAQIAAEVKLDNLIRRGKLADARTAAEQARYRTVQYGEALRLRLEATQRDVLLVDWEEELPVMLNDALKHVEERMLAEHRIHASSTEWLDTTEEPERKFHAAELVAVVEDCLRRHVQLQARLQTARSVFRAEQDRQQFSGPPRRSAINLHGQLLEPVLGLPIRDAVAPLTAFFRVVAGAVPPEVTTLSGLVATLLRPAPEQQRTAGAVVHPNPEGVPDDPRFTAAHRELADGLLNLPGRVRSLSELVEEAAEHGDDLAVLIALLAGNALDPPLETARKQGWANLPLAVPAGRTFTGSAVRGDDLLVTSAPLRESHRTEQGGAA